MADPLALLAALGLGLLLGAWAGVRGGLALAARRRAALGAHAQLARLWPAKLPARSAADILAGVIRVALGGQIYELPVLPRGASRRWLASLDARFATLAAELEQAGNDTPAIMVRLVAEADALYDMLLDYDRAGASILPGREEIDERATDTEILRAVLEVWRAVNPLAATLAETTDEPGTAGLSLAQPTSPRRPTGGAQAISTESPTSSSSPTLTPPPSASSGTAVPISSASSRPSVSAQASSTTPGRTPAGGPGSGPARRSRALPAEG